VAVRRVLLATSPAPAASVSKHDAPRSTNVWREAVVGPPFGVVGIVGKTLTLSRAGPIFCGDSRQNTWQALSISAEDANPAWPSG
jgi:hypothetical protein